ncbi:hypothetical protein WJX73_000283 [Symbiochloris irregularis]|uniref:Uncharacterized protein n=1 Tax=Symbiochloris irregularis TaxID=706552 RepID=A0AAW1PKM3_9CHLO
MAPKRKTASEPQKESEGKKAKTASKTSKKGQGDTAPQKDANKPAKKSSTANASAKSSSKGPHSEKPRTKTASDSPTEPPKAFLMKEGSSLVATSVDLKEGKRNKDGFLVFDGHPEFKPNLTPKQVIQAGSFGGIYFNPKGGKPSIKHPKGVDVSHTEFPEDWFEGLHPDYYIARKYVAKRNKFQVKAGQAQEAWENSGWINDQDQRGWFHWYCRFYQGRRTDDDERQIGRWKGVCGEKGRWKRSLVNKCLSAGKAWNDASVSPVVRQSLLHWAYEITEKQFDKMAKQVK